MFDRTSDIGLVKSIIAEAAKMSGELKSAQADIEKARKRLSFLLAAQNELLNRGKK
jgi:hypothetical protein